MYALHVICISSLLVVPITWHLSNSETRVVNLNWFYESVTSKVAAATSNDSWDYMVFTQRWPISFCYVWEEKSPSNWCSMPTDPDQWTIHGIWPNKNGQKGPNFCNNTWPFDVNQLESFEDVLEQRWPNLEGGTGVQSLWEHEWKKHGTCAAELNSMNSVGKYFKQGLLLNSRFNLTKILLDGGITPKFCGNYSAKQIVSAVQKSLGTNVQVTCVKDKKGVHFLQEIEICLDKTFQPINCTSTKNVEKPKEKLQYGSGVCPKGKVINYPKSVPGFGENCIAKF